MLWYTSGMGLMTSELNWLDALTFIGELPQACLTIARL